MTNLFPQWLKDRDLDVNLDLKALPCLFSHSHPHSKMCPGLWGLFCRLSVWGHEGSWDWWENTHSRHCDPGWGKSCTPSLHFFWLPEFIPHCDQGWGMSPFLSSVTHFFLSPRPMNRQRISETVFPDFVFGREMCSTLLQSVSYLEKNNIGGKS